MFRKPQEVALSLSTQIVEDKKGAVGGYVLSIVQDHLRISKQSQKGGCNFG